MAELTASQSWTQTFMDAISARVCLGLHYCSRNWRSTFHPRALALLRQVDAAAGLIAGNQHI